MPVPPDVVIRAACGDAQALAAQERPSRPRVGRWADYRSGEWLERSGHAPTMTNVEAED